MYPEFGKRTGEPQRNRRSRLYFHYPERLPGDGIAVGAVPEVEVAEPVPYVSVEREPELRVVSAVEGSAVVEYGGSGYQAVAAYHVGHFSRDLPCYVVAGFRRYAFRQESHSLRKVRGNTALVDYSVVFLFYLKEHRGAVRRSTVGAQPELFLVDRLVKGDPGEYVVRRIAVERADCLAGIFVLDHEAGNFLKNGLGLLTGEQVFYLHTLKSIRICHTAHPAFRIHALYIISVTVL